MAVSLRPIAGHPMSSSSPHPPLAPRGKPTGLDVQTTLAHFALVTYYVEPAALRKHVDPRFDLDTVLDSAGREQALISVVPFLDLDFRSALCPWPRFQFGQTNYRAYVSDRVTGEHVAWFFGTSLDTIFVSVPKHAWKLPWYRGRIRFETAFDGEKRRYSTYRMRTESEWAPADLVLRDTGVRVQEFQGFADAEAGFRLLTHPTVGVFYRRDGRLGSYSIWHDRMQLTVGEAEVASFPLLDRLGLVEEGALDRIHSVMIQPAVEFTIYLPPRRL